MKILNQFKMQLAARSSNESFARTVVAAFVSQLDPTLEEISDIKTAVSEAVTNCIVHAYKEKLGTIYITVRILENNKISIKIRDRGCGIPDIKQAMQPAFTTAGRERAGIGFAVMQSFTDKLTVSSRVGYGTTVVMHKILSSKSLDD